MTYYVIVDKSDGYYVAKNDQLCIYADEEIAKDEVASYKSFYKMCGKPCDYEVRKVRLQLVKPSVKRDRKKAESLIENYGWNKRGKNG